MYTKSLPNQCTLDFLLKELWRRWPARDLLKVRSNGALVNFFLVPVVVFTLDPSLPLPIPLFSAAFPPAKVGWVGLAMLQLFLQYR